MAPVKREITEESAQHDDQHHPPNKRSKHHDAFSVSQMQINPLDEPSPLGLRLRKSPSLLDLIQMRLSEGNSFSNSTKEQKTIATASASASASASAATDKLKASNFPASLLKIGTWEYTSKHEGDLVAKCYFAKHKLVWEVLDGGLKNKIEIQWSDIMSLNATYPDNAPGTLNIVLSRQPLFFRETNPQPRKHTLWQATSDFTGGQAGIHRTHCLQCPQGLLGKHYEKLIQCDPRLNFLSQQPEIPLSSPYFESKRSVFDDPNESIGGYNNLSSEGPTTVDFLATKSTSGAQSSCSRPIETPSPTSEMKRGRKKVGGVESSMSMGELVDHIENQMTKHRSKGDLLSNEEEEESLVILEDISRCLFNDGQNGTLTSDEKSIMSRVNSLCCLLQKDPEPVEDLNKKEKIFDEGDGDDDGEIKGVEGGMRRNDSVGELLLNLPRIASLPRFLFNLDDFGNQSR
ncbi:hypothetical protein LXL04_009234 [Taraxacum kok-saghyz]